MNDGIGRMSRSLARKVRDVLGLSDVPSAIQGRFGPAKGMWLIEINDSSDELWIETWPSQRKWNCDFLDPEHRTLEIRSHATDPRSASLNIQFLPVLEDRAVDKAEMRNSIGKSLIEELNREIEDQRNAMMYPLQFRKWVHENASMTRQRQINERVPYLGGLPDSSEERMNFLLDGGFEPQKQKYLQDLAWNIRLRKCEDLKKKMSIKVPNSAYFFMVVDFWGVLEENEVHLCFSSKFQTETFSDSILHGCDVLVARSPAHFVSDVQRVKAVFKPELHALKDVVVFSAKGNVPLADKLSGGDYDGDKAWVCWEPTIVSNFNNAKVLPNPDLSKYLKQDKTTFADLVSQHGKAGAVSDMVSRSISFSMRRSYLGIVTNFKEKLCYHINSVNNNYAFYLSALLSSLVDQAKQGFEFTWDDWTRFRRELLDMHKFGDPKEPAYKSESWSGSGNPVHIIDYLKFTVAKPTIDQELKKFHKAMDSRLGRPEQESRSLRLDKDDGDERAAQYWDPDLVIPHNSFEELASTNPSLKEVLRNLSDDLMALEKQWGSSFSGVKDNDEFPRRINEVYESWSAIQPRSREELDPMLAALLKQTYMGEGHTNWALLRASTCFKYFYNRKPTFTWRMAGIQLQFIKGMTTAGRDSIPVIVSPALYAALKPDNRFISQAVSKMKNEGPEYPAAESDGEDGGQMPEVE